MCIYLLCKKNSLIMLLSIVWLRTLCGVQLVYGNDNEDGLCKRMPIKLSVDVFSE